MKPTRLLVAVSILVLAGCSGLAGRGNWDPFRSAAERQLSIVILNENSAHVTVRAVSAGSRVTLGTITPRTQQVVAIPWNNRNNVRFQIELLAGRRHTTQSLLVDPGDRVQLWIVEPLQRSVVRR